MFEIRWARASDRPQILLLLREIFGDETALLAEKRWQWQWVEDPRLLQPGYKGFVIEWQGFLIASIAMIPAGLYLHGSPIDAFWFAESFVHRKRLGRALRKMRADGLSYPGSDFSNGLIGAILNQPECPKHQLGKHLTEAATVSCYKVGSFDQNGTGSWTRLISLKGLLSAYIGHIPGWIFGSFLDFFINWLPKPVYQAELFSGLFDARFDRLWLEALQSHHAITRRDSAYLNWRYRKNPDTTYQTLTISEGESLMGYVVYSVFERHGQPRAHILDLLALSDDHAVLSSLMLCCIQRLRDEGVTKLECYTGSSAIVSVLRSLRFSQRLQKGKPHSTLVRSIHVDELYITRGDGDGG